MAVRKEVFQSKVLQKLYPTASKPEKESFAPSTVDPLPKKTVVKRTTEGNSNIGNTTTIAKRIYTVLPPPADYTADSEKSVTHTELEKRQSAEDPDEKSGDGSNDEEASELEEKKRRRRRKKRKNVVLPLNQAAVNDGEEHLSKNRKRKLKKKRHKEKLLSMGLVPRAAAVEFTFQRESPRPAKIEEKEEESSCQSNEPAQDQAGEP